MRKTDTELGLALESIDIEYYLDREGIDYKVTRGSSGVQLNVKDCPRCGDNRWKVYLNAENALGNCFICSPTRGGFSMYSFTKSAFESFGEGSYAEYIKQIAREQGWRPKRKYEEVEKKDLEGLPESFPLPTPEGKNIRYLEQRGVDAGLCAHFGLRYSPNGKFEFVDPYGDKRKQDYSKRIIIPIYDLEGKLISFQGRDATGLSEKRYMFPPGHTSSGNVLYNAWNILHEKCKTLFLCEGVFDVIAAYKYTKVPVVGSFGKSLSFNQIEQLLKLKEKIGFTHLAFCWDGELNAASDAIKTAEKINAVGLKSKLVLLPKNKDPNECTAEEFLSSIKSSIPLETMADYVKARVTVMSMYS